jgi:hypothetical protein
LTLASPQSSGDWGAGYNVQLWVGDDASALNVSDAASEIAVKNAYLSLQVPVGNGLSVDVGRFDTILGMESIDANRNPHYTHSNGYAIEPTLHEGLKTSYQLTDNVGVSLLFANTIDAANNGASAESDRRTYGVALNLTAPDSMGALSGATLDVAWIEGNTNGGSTAVTNMYVGASIPLPIDKLSAGLAWDNREQDAAPTDSALGLYLEYAHSDKLTLNARVERVGDGALKADLTRAGEVGVGSDAWDITVTANYALWAGVSSRLEYRWTIEDMDVDGDGNDENSLFANLIYEF